MDRFPLMLYRVPGRELIHGVLCETLTVQDDDELEGAQADGWHLTATDAGAEAAGQKDEAAAAAHALLVEREAAAAEEHAKAIRAPLEADLERVSRLLDACYKDVAKAQDDLKAEQQAHAATQAKLAAALEPKTGTSEGANTGKSGKAKA